MLSLCGYWAVWKPWDTVPGVGKLSLRRRTAGADSGVPRRARRPRPFDSQALGHPGAATRHGRAENRVGARRLDLSQIGHG